MAQDTWEIPVDIFDEVQDFPVTGTAGLLYIDESSGLGVDNISAYTWDGSQYNFIGRVPKPH